MYSIGYVIYGVRLTEKANDLFDDSSEHFETVYNGGSDYISGWCGVKLGEFDICEDFPMSKLTTLQPTENQKEEAKKLFDALPQKAKDAYGSTKLDIWIVWGTS